MVSTEELLFDPSQLIAPPSATICVRIMKKKAPMVALVNYSPANPFIIPSPTAVSLQSLSLNMAKLNIFVGPQIATKPILIIGGSGGQQVLDISEVTRTV